MNKTVNINLAGIFFHIDEDAYVVLQNYLNAIKRSFANTPGNEEILADIEARIAELFNEKIKNERQVISTREVEEIIAIMGKPEDYLVDEEIFEDEPVKPQSKTSRQLYRDPENGYIGGVSKGLGYYLGIEAIWIRLLWVLLTLGSSGAFILIYIALWIFVPEARTTAEKLSMRGEPVNISNIERKIKEGFDDVSGKMKDIDYQKYGNRAKSGAGSAATAISSGINTFLNILAKFIGILILLIAGSTLIGLFIVLFTLGTFGIIDAPWATYFEMTTIGEGTLWIFSILSFFAIGIPFFFLFILGLKILMNNFRSMGTTAKLVLLGLWIISVLGLIFFGIKQATESAFTEEVVLSQPLPISKNDTLLLKMNSNPNFQIVPERDRDVALKYNNNNEKVLFSSDIQFMIRTTQDSTGRIEIEKSAEGSSYEKAREHAKNIDYQFSFDNNTLSLNSYLTSGPENKYRNQEVDVFLTLPVGTVLYVSENSRSFHRNYKSIFRAGDEGHYLLITENGTQCLDCPEDEIPETWEELEEEWENDTDSIWDQPEKNAQDIDTLKS